MKLQNKKTGEIVDFVGVYNVTHLNEVPQTNRFQLIVKTDGNNICKEFTTLESILDEYKSYSEKGCWCIEFDEDIFNAEKLTNETKKRMKEIGNCFETKEEAEKALEKLKAWKRLKDKGFDRVFSLELGDALCGGKTVAFKLLIDDKDSIEDIKRLFGVEE